MLDLPQEQEWVLEMVNNTLIEVLGTIAEQERATIKTRQAEGVAAAKAKGKKLGRPAISYPDNWNETYASWKAGEITAKAAIEQTGIIRTSFYRMTLTMIELSEVLQLRISEKQLYTYIIQIIERILMEL